VYEKHFSTYDDYADSSDDSPTLLKADAAASVRMTPGRAWPCFARWPVFGRARTVLP
jgi:hypothetical protein